MPGMGYNIPISLSTADTVTSGADIPIAFNFGANSGQDAPFTQTPTATATASAAEGNAAATTGASGAGASSSGLSSTMIWLLIIGGGVAIFFGLKKHK